MKKLTESSPKLSVLRLVGALGFPVGLVSDTPGWYVAMGGGRGEAARSVGVVRGEPVSHSGLTQRM